MERKHTFVYGIKGKLISAVAMLLVAVIMVVSSTYAWFTLSTAPEVTGITTNIGANGALEIALNYAGSTPLDTVLPQGASTELRNTYWGNLVDLSGSTYGLDQITINPSQLIYTTSGGIDFTKGVLQIPVYGADGRVSELAANSSVGMFQNGSFIPVTDNVTNASGVRAIGLSSGLTERQLAYRNARSAAINAAAAAIKAATTSLQTNGSGMANIAVKHALATGSETETYNEDDKAALQGVVTDLKGVIAYIEEAYVQYIYALAASNVTDESHYQAIKLWVESGSMTFDAFMTAAKTNSDTHYAAASTVLAKDTAGTIETGYDALQITKASLASAQTKIDNLTGNSYRWDAISAPLNDLVRYNGITVNGTLVTDSGIKSHVINTFSKQGLNVEMGTGNGIYADIADHCGSYEAPIKIEKIDVGLGEPLDVDAVLKANSTKEYLDNVGDVVTGAGLPATGTDASKPISEFYGYILDFVFRTNAAGSNLLLQTAPVDRIYNEKGEESLTWGHGSTMQFTKTAADYSLKQMVELMSAIRIVFFNPADSSVFATAKLDMSYTTYTAPTTENGNTESFTGNKFEVIGNDTIKAQVKVCTTWTYFYANGFIYTVNGAVPSESVASYTKVGNDYFDKDGNKVIDESLANSLTLAPATHVLKEDGKYYATAAPNTAITDAATISNLTNLPENQKNTVENIIEDKATIKALAQNSIEAVSTLVYLDGQFVKNSSVAASGTASVTGKLNLQFSSSAALTPMNYSGFDNMFNGRVTKGTTSLPLPAEKTYRLVDATNWSGDVTDLNGLAAPATGWSVNGTTLTIPENAPVGTKVIALVVDGENKPTGEYYTIEIISAPAQGN